MLINFQQSGGVAGLTRPPVTIDTAALSPEEARRWHDLVAEADFFNQPAQITTASARDAFSYDISIDADGRVHSVRTQDTGGTGGLHALVEQLRQAARQGTRRPPS